MDIARAYEFFKAAIAAYKAQPGDLETYENFKAALQEKRGGGLTEKYVRETYDQWRRNVIKDELTRANFKEIAAPVLLEKSRLLSLLAAILAATAIVFPPFHLSQGETTYHLGFFYIGSPRAGDINAQLLLCELVAIWAIWRFLGNYIAPPK